MLMFYSNLREDRLRFGDVLAGFISAAPTITKPIYKNGDLNDPFKIDVHLPICCAVMDPCCHIGDQTILLTPLSQIPDQFWDSSYIVEDVTRINREGVHEKGFMHPEQWNGLSEAEKIAALNSEPRYGLNNYFIYISDDLFQPYYITKKYQYKEVIDTATRLPRFERVNAPLSLRINHYAIDFKKIYRVNCEGINRRTTKREILDSKKLQLSIETRNILRRKMAHYFGDIPEEDRIVP